MWRKSYANNPMTMPATHAAIATVDVHQASAASHQRRFAMILCRAVISIDRHHRDGHNAVEHGAQYKPCGFSGVTVMTMRNGRGRKGSVRPPPC
jgi:hypothetical protein